jgi:hypothetical protein
MHSVKIREEIQKAGCEVKIVYRVIEELSARNLEVEVNKAILDGWVVLGGVVVVNTSGSDNHFDGLMWAQAVTRESRGGK